MLINRVLQDNKIVTIKCGESKVNYTLYSLITNDNKAPKYYDICDDKIYEEGCESD